MEQTWYDELTFEDVGATYGTAQVASKAPTRGDLNRITLRRSGDGDGAVTVEVAEDSAFQRPILEIEATLSGAGDTDVWGAPFEPKFRSVAGPYFRVKDAADSADDIILSMAGARHHGA